MDELAFMMCHRIWEVVLVAAASLHRNKHSQLLTHDFGLYVTDGRDTRWFFRRTSSPNPGRSNLASSELTPLRQVQEFIAGTARGCLRGASSGDALLALGGLRPHPKELGDISQKPDESDRRGNKTAARIDDNLGSREFEVTAPRQNPTPACRKDILDPPGIRSIGEEKDIVIAAAEHVDRRVVHFPRGSPPISQDAESGSAAGKHTSDWVDEARDEMTKTPQPRSVRHALPSLATLLY